MMTTFDWLFLSVTVNSVYLFVCLRQKSKRLILPSTITCFTWMVVSILMITQIEGIIQQPALNPSKFRSVAPMIFWMSVLSVIGFILAHIATEQKLEISENNFKEISIGKLDYVLDHYKWVLYLCFIIGLLMFYFFYSVSGSIDNLSEYRMLALNTKRTGWMAWVQRLSGHIGILGSFYLIVLGYRHGITEINFRQVVVAIALFSSINMSIGGRLWIVQAILPYMAGYFWGLNVSGNTFDWKNIKKMTLLAVIMIALFSILGNLRSDEEYRKKHNFFTKFLYYTDGPRMTNMVLERYPDGTFDLEYGASNFLSQWVESPMKQRFKDSISHDIGLSVTVRSTIPPLYYDFGYIGAIIAWGIICFILELSCMNLMYTNNIVGVILFGTLSIINFQSPVFEVIQIAMPSLEWILILFFFRNRLFKP